ncbi:MAG: serine hydrolase [Candidatus Aminicenantes bacterium]|nr:MAG: serine hydrolase [Candidatus Aminicenantes bacterium]
MATFSKMKQKPIAFFICFFIASLVLLSAAQGEINLSELESYFEAARKEWKIPGMAVAIVKDGKVVLAKGYGIKEFSKKEKVDEKTLFAIASNTKAFTAATLAILKDEGKINWDDRVREYLPYFKLYDPYVTEEMTIRDLLCHRSGLKTFSGDLLWYETSYSTVEVIKRARYLKPAFGFRSGYGYSNIMFMAAGEIVPAVTGKPWKDFIKERIFKPLAMNTTNIGTTDLKKYNNVATPHYVYLDGRTVTVPYTPSDSLGGAGSINSNVIEMAQWVKMLLNNGVFDNQRILGEDSIWEMWSSHTVNRVTRSAKELFPTTHFRSYGLGWGLSDYHGYKVIGHGGGLDGMISRVALVPEIKLGLVILTNSINGLPTGLTYKIIDTYLGVKPKDWSRIYLERYNKSVKKEMQRGLEITKKRVKGAHTGVKLEDYAGLYQGPMYGDAAVTLKKGKLVLELLPAPIFISDLAHLHYDTFVLKLRNTFSFVPHGTGTVQFIRDKQGNVVEMKVDIPNRDFWFDELEFKRKPGEEENQ